MRWVRDPLDVELVHHIPQLCRGDRSDAPAVLDVTGGSLTYSELEREIARVAGGLQASGMAAGERVLINLPKCPEMVISVFAITRAGGIAVPTNPNYSPHQIRRIIADCTPSVVISSSVRLRHLTLGRDDAPSVRHWIVCGSGTDDDGTAWDDLGGSEFAVGTRPDQTAAILYTSGSSGSPKGVVLSHENLVLGAKSVAHYLGNEPDDCLLAALPLSFDAGLSQVTTALLAGGSVVLLDYMFPSDVVKAVEKFRITGLTAVPPLWQALSMVPWPAGARHSLRYFASTGGRLHPSVLERLLRLFPGAKPYLMYGLTEAFRSTYLPPEQASERPDSIGKAVPNAEVFVLRPDGSESEPYEHGEIVHVGPLVSRGYWNGASESYARFAPAPACASVAGRAVWSGDVGYRDREGYLYFVARRDEVMKISGHRVSPLEVEAAAMSCPIVSEACAFAREGEQGQDEIWLVTTPSADAESRDAAERSALLLAHMRGSVPNHVLPSQIRWVPSLVKDPNGKINRSVVKADVLKLEDRRAS